MLIFSDGMSNLPPSISNIPWGDAYKMGAGVDAVTGEVFDNSALAPFEISPASVGEGQFALTIISTEEELEREIEAGASGSYNTGSVTVSGEASYLNKVSYSATSLTVLARVEISDTDYATIKDPALSAEARALLDSDQERFKKVHGDYYISGVKSGSTLSVVLTVTAESESRLDDFKAKFSASKGNMFSAEGYANFKQAVSSSKTTFKQEVTHYGTNSGVIPPKADNPDELLAWFKENLQAAPLRAYLSSYSGLDANFDRSVPVAPSVFGEISALYKKVWLVENRYLTCPGGYGEAYADTYNKLTAEIRAARNELATDPTRIAGYRADLSALLADLDVIFARYALYMSAKGAKSSVPEKGKEIESGKVNIWHYGYDTWPGLTTGIMTKTESYHKDWKFAAHRSHTFSWGGSSEHICVGFTVQSVWTSNNGSWQRTGSNPILNNTGSVYVESELTRGTSWKVKWHYVDAAEYKFG